MGRRGLLYALALVIGAAACVGDDPQQASPATCPGPGCANDAGGVEDGQVDGGSSAAVLLAIDPTDVTITQSTTAKIKVDIQRVGGVSAPVHVEVAGLPATILAGALTIAPGVNAGELVLSAAADTAPTKTPLAVTVTARAESGESATKDVKLTVRGAPGAVDVNFGTNGVVVQSFGTGSDFAKCVLFDAMGRLYVGGNTANGPAVARYTNDGKLDTTYAAPNGYVVGPAMYTEDCAMQSDGKVVFVGRYNDDLAVSRINADGTVDTGFGSSGRAAHDFGGAERGTGIVVLADGTIVATGFSTNGTPSEKFIALRVSSAGIVGTPSSLTNIQLHDQAWGAALAMDGDVLVVGMSGPTYSIGDVSSVLVQALDPTSLARDTATFGSGQGYVIDGHYGTNQFYAGRAVVQSDGKIVVTGSGYGAATTIRVIRYSKAGVVDSSFATGGYASLSVGTAAASGNAIALQKDGKIIVAGVAEQTPGEVGDFAIVRLGTNGLLDDSFNGDGKLVVPMQPMKSDTPYAIGIQPDGKIVVAGQTLTAAGNFDWAITRVWP